MAHNDDSALRLCANGGGNEKLLTYLTLFLFPLPCMYFTYLIPSFSPHTVILDSVLPH